MAVNFPNMMKMNIHTQEAQQTSSQISSKIATPRQVIIKLWTRQYTRIFKLREK